jgi:alpha-glucosidase
MNSSVWWRDAAIYQVYPRSFRDSNGDGEGDLQGVIAGLPYLADLGVDAIWLSPFYTSPNNDGGYDVSDPRDVDPRFGTLLDAKELIDAAHSHGIKFITDIVPNHFSSEHRWFKEALAAPKGSSARSRFHFYDGRGENGEIPPNNWISIFRGPAWTRTLDGQWYLHLFDSSQPDLNWNNPDVAADFEETLRFWLDLGVDGFRIDVAHGCVKEDISIDHRNPERLVDALRLDFLEISESERAGLLADIPFFDREGVHDIYRKWRQILDQYPGDRMAVAEAFVYPSSRAARYVRAGELNQVFNFNFMMMGWDAPAMKASIERTLAELADVKAPATWVLNNHDTPRVVTRIGGARQARALAMLTHSLPGGIYIYQGEELGLPSADLPDAARQDPAFIRSGGADKGRDECRVPIPWNSTLPNYGYGNATPWLPQPVDWAQYAMDVEVQDPSSSWALYKKSLSLRHSHPALGGEGSLTWIDAPAGLLHFTREPGLEVVVNTTEATIEMSVSGNSILLESASGSSLRDGRLAIAGNTTIWLQC